MSIVKIMKKVITFLCFFVIIPYLSTFLCFNFVLNVCFALTFMITMKKTKKVTFFCCLSFLFFFSMILFTFIIFN